MDRFHRAVVIICYFFGFIPSGIVLLAERRHSGIRFHAAQSFLFHLTLLIIFIPMSCLGTWFVIESSRTVGIGILAAATTFELIMAIAWVRLMIGAIGGNNPRLPFFARLADRTICATI